MYFDNCIAKRCRKKSGRHTYLCPPFCKSTRLSAQFIPLGNLTDDTVDFNRRLTERCDHGITTSQNGPSIPGTAGHLLSFGFGC